MLTIGICVDKKKESEEIQKMARSIMFSKAEVKLCIYADGEGVLQEVRNGSFVCNLLLLDVHMSRPDSMQIAHELRKQQIDTDIIFVTCSREHIFEGYTCKAFDSISKPCMKERLEEALTRYLEEFASAAECLDVKIQRSYYKIPLSQIYYFKSDKRKVIIHMRNHEEVKFYEKLKTLDTLLQSKGFIRCHQSYLVQKRYVDGFRRGGIIIQNTRIPVSRRYYDELKEMFGGDSYGKTYIKT